MKTFSTALLLTAALLLSPLGAAANTQMYVDVTNATQNAIVKKMAEANVMTAYEDDLFYPEATVTRAELADMITRAYKLYNVRPAKQFNDVTEDTDYADSIQQLYRAGIIDGTANGDFNPYQEVKRTHVAKILTNLLKLTPTPTTKFKDVPTSLANNVFIGALVEKGIIAGYPDGTFKPNQAVSRINMATFLYRALYGKEQQIENKKITSNTAYAATKLQAANYASGTGYSYYIEFDTNGNAKPKFEGIMQTFSTSRIHIYQRNSDWTAIDTDLRHLVEFKPYTLTTIHALPYAETYWAYDGSYTTTPYFNQDVTINNLKFTGTLKIVQKIEAYYYSDDVGYNVEEHEAVFYFKEGYGLLSYTFNNRTVLAMTGYKLR
ncbi:S-layer homology domain-containing protein [Caryophanon latum]|uniref:SLH domain-containing protein n=1 Tax=Caryophanon latum TaxID=33977 RepID=A0A1C0YD54_9BACL|nr:S-layer homology domain-containing protein [Caryophanon latum]OCS85074.1 hypothetical protein A6K76_15275 [Caryophanon latum]